MPLGPLLVRRVFHLPLFLLAAFLLACLLARHASSRDPGSIFFDPTTAYAPRYSAVRVAQALDHVAGVKNETSSPGPTRQGGDGDAAPPQLCVGIPSVAREGARYLRTAVGALLAGLTAAERAAIYVIVFIPQTAPERHPAWGEAWLHALPDQVLLYRDRLSAAQLEHVRGLEADPEGWRAKELLDYELMLSACYAATEARFVAVFEDDTLALDGWFHRTMHGLRLVGEKTARARSGPDEFLYLRLFYTEEFLGFNLENWKSYTFWTLVVLMGVFVVARALYAYVPRSSRAPSPVNFAITGVIFASLFILLFFSTGKVSKFPLRPGVHEMSNYGCCAQGLVFPRNRIPPLIEWYSSRGIGFVDTLMEQYADEHGELRWALTPPVIQHIGRKSSKGDAFLPGSWASPRHGALTVAERMWSFAFETNNAAALRAEHELVAAAAGDGG